MPHDNEETVLVANLVAQMVGPVVPGSQLYECDSCKRFVWIGPIEAALAKGEYYDAIVCTRCAVEGRR